MLGESWPPPERRQPQHRPLVAEAHPALAARLVDLGITHAQVAGLVGCSRPKVSMVLTGRLRKAAPQVLQAAAALIAKAEADLLAPDAPSKARRAEIRQVEADSKRDSELSAKPARKRPREPDSRRAVADKTGVSPKGQRAIRAPRRPGRVTAPPRQHGRLGRAAARGRQGCGRLTGHSLQCAIRQEGLHDESEGGALREASHQTGEGQGTPAAREAGEKGRMIASQVFRLLPGGQPRKRCANCQQGKARIARLEEYAVFSFELGISTIGRSPTRSGSARP